MKNTILSALSEAFTTARISPADLIRISASAIAETGCKCRKLPSSPVCFLDACQACLAALTLTGFALEIISEDTAINTVVVMIDRTLRTAKTTWLKILPGIVEGLLNLDPASCTCSATDVCPICSAAWSLDNLTRELRAA
jgi:hypothetical protein